MRHWSQLVRRSFTAVLLAAGMFTAVAASAQTGTYPGGSFGGELRGGTRFHGTIVCANCTLEQAQAANPRLGHLYAFASHRGQVILHLQDADERMWWESIAGLSNKVWLRAPDEVLASLTAEENLFKQVEITGLLRKSGVFDIGAVYIRG